MFILLFHVTVFLYSLICVYLLSLEYNFKLDTKFEDIYEAKI